MVNYKNKISARNIKQMTSVMPHIKTIPSENSFFINLASLDKVIYRYNPADVAPFSTATWADTAQTTAKCPSLVSTALNQAGRAVLRDLGKTVVSSLRTFRKVQLVTSSISNGVYVGSYVGTPGATNSGSQTLGEEYFTGYIEVIGANGSVGALTGNTSSGFQFAPVARLG